MDLVKQLKHAIHSSGQSVYAISNGSGIDHAAIHRFVSGERTITVETAAKLAAYFNLELRPRDAKRAAKRSRRT